MLLMVDDVTTLHSCVVGGLNILHLLYLSNGLNGTDGGERTQWPKVHCAADNLNLKCLVSSVQV